MQLAPISIPITQDLATNFQKSSVVGDVKLVNGYVSSSDVTNSRDLLRTKRDVTAADSVATLAVTSEVDVDYNAQRASNSQEFSCGALTAAAAAAAVATATTASCDSSIMNSRPALAVTTAVGSQSTDFAMAAAMHTQAVNGECESSSALRPNIVTANNQLDVAALRDGTRISRDVTTPSGAVVDTSSVSAAAPVSVARRSFDCLQSVDSEMDNHSLNSSVDTRSSSHLALSDNERLCSSSSSSVIAQHRSRLLQTAVSRQIAHTVSEAMCDDSEAQVDSSSRDALRLMGRPHQLSGIANSTENSADSGSNLSSEHELNGSATNVDLEKLRRKSDSMMVVSSQDSEAEAKVLVASGSSLVSAAAVGADLEDGELHDVSGGHVSSHGAFDDVSKESEKEEGELSSDDEQHRGQSMVASDDEEQVDSSSSQMLPADSYAVPEGSEAERASDVITPSNNADVLSPSESSVTMTYRDSCHSQDEVTSSRASMSPHYSRWSSSYRKPHSSMRDDDISQSTCTFSQSSPSAAAAVSSPAAAAGVEASRAADSTSCDSRSRHDMRSPSRSPQVTSSDYRASKSLEFDMQRSAPDSEDSSPTSAVSDTQMPPLVRSLSQQQAQCKKKVNILLVLAMTCFDIMYAMSLCMKSSSKVALRIF